MTLRLILAGLGVRGRHWAKVISRSSRCELVAYVDPNSAAFAAVTTEYGERPTFATLDAALAELTDVDGIVLANPPLGREVQIRAAAERGIPVLVEKPLALELDEAARLTAIAEAVGIPLMVGLNFRYLGVTQAVKAIIAQEQVGTPAFARFTYERYRDGHRPDLNKYPLTMAHPMLWEQSIHHFDLMRFVYDSEPVSVMCQTWNPSWSMYDDDTNVAAIFTFENGMVINYQGTWQSGWAEPRFEWRTDCTNGVISQRDQFGNLYYAQKFDAELTPVALPPHEQWITETAGLLDAFIAAVADHAPLQCSARDHLHALAMVEACILSSRENRSVSISDVLRLPSLPTT